MRRHDNRCGIAKVFSVVRSFLVSLVIAAVLFAGIETIIRFGFPQTLSTTLLGEDSLGQRDPHVGHTNRPNAHARVTGPEFDVEYMVNEQGYRDAALYTADKPEGVTRVLLLGDSFTFGSGNDYADIWPVLLENNLQKQGHGIEVIKAGVPGFDTRREVLYLERLYDDLQPDIVAFVFLPNDLFTNTPITETVDAPVQQRDDGLRTKRDKKSSLHSVTLFKRMLMLNDSLYERLYLLTGRRNYFSTDPNSEVLSQFDETEKLLQRANAFCTEKGCEFMVLSIPQQFQVLVEARATTPEGVDATAIDTRLEAFATEEGFQWISLLPELAKNYREQSEPLYYRFDGHMNQAGNRVAAEIISEALKDRLAQRNAAVNSEPLSQ